MKRRGFSTAALLFVLSAWTGTAFSQTNYDESKIPKYQLPDPLQGVKSAEEWPKRRAEILALFEQEMYGKAPLFKGVVVAAKDPPKPKKILDGKAILHQRTIQVAGCDLQLLMITPAGKQPAPAFLSYNFGGNHTILPDSEILLAKGWVRGGNNNQADEGQRGTKTSRWAVEKIIDRGHALITLYYGDVDPDFHDEFKNGVHAAYPHPKANEWGSVAGWAWGLSRVMDYLETKPLQGAINAKRVAVMGHSRLGKTSLWAGATDERFALVISNNSGCGGAALSRRRIGETVGRINKSFSHWFCENFKKYNNNEDELPIDQHMLIALMAPRPVYVASAVGDRWADPRG
ncbi:MAG: acetylxylan esterase, partial [Planctomycetales bacterium]